MKHTMRVVEMKDGVCTAEVVSQAMSPIVAVSPSIKCGDFIEVDMPMNLKRPPCKLLEN